MNNNTTSDNKFGIKEAIGLPVRLVILLVFFMPIFVGMIVIFTVFAPENVRWRDISGTWKQFRDRLLYGF